MSRIIFRESAAPTTPASGQMTLFADTNGDLSWLDDGGNLTKLVTTGTATITLPNQTDTIAVLGTQQTFTARPIFSTTIGVGGATPSTSGSGVTFPASQSPSSEANTLDDYEEGTWTVRIADAASGGNLSATTATGQYTIIGRFIECIFNIGPISTSGLTGANQLYIRGFPFNWSIIAIRGQGSIATENVTYTGNISLEPIGGAGACRIVESNSNAAWTTITVSDLTATTATLQGRISGII